LRHALGDVGENAVADARTVEQSVVFQCCQNVGIIP
jgi:hypothetical protein